MQINNFNNENLARKILTHYISQMYRVAVFFSFSQLKTETFSIFGGQGIQV